MNTLCCCRIALGRARRPRRGQALVEFALAALLFFGFLVAILEGARWLATYFLLANAAAEGARAGAFAPTPGWPQADIDAKIRMGARSVLAPWIDLPDANITICRAAPATDPCTTSVSSVLSGNDLVVTVTYTFQWVPFAAGWLGQAADQITVSHRERIE
jgi:Flp pilus assembly protein TadG